MTKSLIKNTFREIKNTKARFISILAIIALGVGFFSGIKATVPSMYNLAETYYKEQNLMDFRLVSTTGFDEADIAAVSGTSGVESVMPSYFTDVLTTAQSGGEAVRLIALPKSYKDNREMNAVVLKSGRLPKKSDEIAVDALSMKGEKYKLGDKVVFSKIAGERDVTEDIEKLEYTVVGTVESPLYISYQRGNTNIGDGKIGEFMYILPETFKTERYTELYVRADFSDGISAFSDEYDEKISAMKSSLEEAANARCELFNTDVRDKAYSDFEKAKEEYESEKAKADKKLNEAKNELDKAQKDFNSEIKKAEKKLSDAEAQIKSGEAELEKSRKMLSEKITAAQAKINANKKELEKGRAEYKNGKAELEAKTSAAQSEIDKNRAEYEKSYAQFKNTDEPQLLAAIGQAQGVAEQLKLAISQTTDEQALFELNSQLAQAQATEDALNAQYSQALQSFEQAKSELDNAQTQLNKQKSEGEKKLSESLSKLEQGEAALQSGQKELNSQKSSGEAQIAQAQSKLNKAREDYSAGKSELEKSKKDGQKKLDKALEEYNDKKSEADEKFKEAKAELDKAEKELEDIPEPEWYVFTRDDNPGYSSFPQNADRLDAVATVFPLFFLLVAVLVCVTTMTRLVEEKRTEIATLKALGYGNLSIIGKFVIYSLIAGVAGSVIGTLAGVFSLPFIIFNAYKIMYYIGDITLVLHVPSVVLGFVSAVVCTTAVAAIVCARSLRVKPAQAMRPKAPKPGKRILLEYITPVWKRMGFTSKLVSRNLFRYKSRLFMTVLGVAGCTALIVAAFGLLNSFDPLTHDQFETIYKYDAVVIPKNAGPQEELSYLSEEAQKSGDVKRSMLALQEDLNVEFGSNLKNESTYLCVYQEPDKMGELISLHDRKTKKELTLSDNGVLINEKLAEEFGIKKGDTIKLSSDSGKAEVTVTGIFEQYLHNYVYMTPSLYKTLYQKDISYNMLNAKLENYSEESEAEFSSKMLENSKVVAVSFVNASLGEFRNMFDSLNLVVFVMIISAAALAFVVLYNLTNINIAERVREIATFKVLGFYNRETNAFIYKENILLSLLGVAAGLVLGFFLTGFIIRTVEVDNIMFGRVIYFTSYLYAAGLTMLFSVLVNIVMNFKLKAISMVESLKSVE